MGGKGKKGGAGGGGRKGGGKKSSGAGISRNKVQAPFLQGLLDR